MRRRGGTDFEPNALRDVSPCFAFGESTSVGFANSVISGNSRNAHSPIVVGANAGNNFIIDFRKRVFVATHGARRSFGTALISRVRHVLGMSSQKDMAGIAAWKIVTFMTSLQPRNRPNKQFINNFMDIKPPTLPANLSIPERGAVRSPLPTVVGSPFVNSWPYRAFNAAIDFTSSAVWPSFAAGFASFRWISSGHLA